MFTDKKELQSILTSTFGSIEHNTKHVGISFSRNKLMISLAKLLTILYYLKFHNLRKVNSLLHFTVRDEYNSMFGQKAKNLF